MDEQLAVEETEYWMELEKLLARFHQDLSRVVATVAAVGHHKLVSDLECAQWWVGVACSEVAHTVAHVPSQVDPCTYP